MAFGRLTGFREEGEVVTPAAATTVYLVASLCWLGLAYLVLDQLFAHRPDLRHFAAALLDLMGVGAMSAIVYLLTARMRTQHQASSRRIREQAARDPLTALYNRQAFDDFFHQAIGSARRNGEALALLFLDLDRFKEINDRRGHGAGDALLVETARRLKLSCQREDDLVARVGGDEFALLLRGPQLPEGPEVMAQRILEGIAQPLKFGGRMLSVSACLGIAVYPDDGQEAQQLFGMADLALSQAKQQGRSKFCFYGGEWQQQRDRRIQLEQGLLRAIAHDELFLVYQPKVDVASRRVIGVEALVRWNHPHLGVLSPASFVPLAEKAGLMWGLTEWVLKAACRQAALWYRDEGLDVNVAVNVSPATFANRDLEQAIEQALFQAGLPPDRLTVEITEETLMVYGAESLAALERLSRMGVAVQMDDFGTGYSSLSSMKHYRFQALKIDRSFVSDVVSSTEDAAIVTTIMYMARCLDMEAIAEGVESEEQQLFLASIGCRYMQGFHFSRPLTPAEFSAFIARFGKD